MKLSLSFKIDLSTNNRYGPSLSEITISDNFGSMFAEPPLFFSYSASSSSSADIMRTVSSSSSADIMGTC